MRLGAAVLSPYQTTPIGKRSARAAVFGCLRRAGGSQRNSQKAEGRCNRGAAFGMATLISPGTYHATA